MAIKMHINLIITNKRFLSLFWRIILLSDIKWSTKSPKKKKKKKKKKKTTKKKNWLTEYLIHLKYTPFSENI